MSKNVFYCNYFIKATKRHILDTESKISQKNAEIAEQENMGIRAAMSWNPGEF